MSFLAPMAFWFAAAIPVVILFYLLKRKRVVRLVSSTLLWQKFLAETQASAPFQKLRHIGCSSCKFCCCSWSFSLWRDPFCLQKQWRPDARRHSRRVGFMQSTDEPRPGLKKSAQKLCGWWMQCKTRTKWWCCKPAPAPRSGNLPPAKRPPCAAPSSPARSRMPPHA